MSFNTKLINLLKADPRFVDDEGELVPAAVQDRAWKTDRDLVKLLLSDAEIKTKFFEEIEGHWIFNLNTFIDYISQKNFLDNSYTRFRNRIGLTIGDKYLRERGDVALAWPYKDTVLEGGQTKEEERRKEIFFNEVLAHDEINRLFDPKVLTNFVRYTAKGKEKVTGFKRDENGVIRENLIIKGNNLLALHTLKTQFRGQVKLIYIDPPYNTGNDSFGYNDSFNHSTWLTFMKNRLTVAEDLLKDGGAIFVQCDDNEQAYLKVLMDEVFGSANFVNCISVKLSEPTGVKMAHTQIRFPKIKEYLLFYKKNQFVFELIDKIKKEKWDTEYKYFLENFSTQQRGALRKLQQKETNDQSDVIDAMNIFTNVRVVPVDNQLNAMKIVDNKRDEWKFDNAWRIVQRVSSDSIRNFVKGLSKLPSQDIGVGLSSDHVLFFYNTKANLSKGGRIRITFADDFLYVNPCDFWQDIKTTGIAKEGGVSLPYGKKPERLIHRIILMTTKKNDIVMDYHVGSGTTCAVAHKMGRQYIGIEQLQYGENDSIVRLENVIQGDQSGISKSVNWQGGGEFIYCELMKYNEIFMERIQAAKSSKELLKIWKDMAEGSFLNWYVNSKIPEEAVKYFEELGKGENGPEKQKRLLAELLDKNQLYVNLTEIDDAQFKVSKEDKELNKAFYGETYNA